ncbi:hypothetical protein C900_00981 [Fulvivirga imtechensis AK7]|uniref:Methyltransferase domain-containing protein n=1 Tax=Fulvivirga imtechensis AK7 TaxID=1237149 RepID=L8JZI0_9BACT|nr:class I SAM-dependent methyltransferase [Fulvivirga imtechensis]ELR72602.1 hypothetical protein C900_00981 [Fulvivirga imtechensis AK7]
MTVKEHYDNHLASFYSWMAGDFDQQSIAFGEFLEDQNITPVSTKVAVDLGAGHGIQSIALKTAGFDVTAVDFNDQLLKELKSHPDGKAIRTIEADIRHTWEFEALQPELIVCCGDTITHLESKSEVEKLIKDCADMLVPLGKLILSFRDYTVELDDLQRFIPVKSDERRIFTCILEYTSEKVKVTDQLYEKTGSGWKQKVSTYSKVRITPREVETIVMNSGMELSFSRPVNRMHTLIAQKRD